MFHTGSLSLPEWTYGDSITGEELPEVKMKGTKCLNEVCSLYSKREECVVQTQTSQFHSYKNLKTLYVTNFSTWDEKNNTLKILKLHISTVTKKKQILFRY